MDAFIEVDHSDKLSPFSDPVQIWSLTKGSFVFGKDYKVYDALAWGRESQMSPDGRDPATLPLFAPRGMPSPQSLDVAWNYFFLVAEPSDPPDKYFWQAHRCISPTEADYWVKNRGAGESKVLQWFNCGPAERTWRVVADPVLHNASWLLLPEFDASLAHHGLRLEELPVEYSIVRNALSMLGRQRGTERVRLVFWFC
jgi:hypothetical protein